MFCTRSYAVGADTDSVIKASLKPTRKRWDEAFAYMEKTKVLQDIVVSGGDSYYLQPEHIMMIGHRLVSMDNIKRFRFASKGLAVSPNRILDNDDKWVDAMIAISNKAKEAGKTMALHTHFNHPNEISWITKKACQKLFEAGVMVRNQAVLLRGVNDDVDTMSRLIQELADMAVFPVSEVSVPGPWSRRLTTENSTTSISATWLRRSSTSARPSRPSWTLRPRSADRLPAS